MILLFEEPIKGSFFHVFVISIFFQSFIREENRTLVGRNPSVFLLL